MRPWLFAALGLIEFAVAAALIVLAVSLPTGDDVRKSFQGAGRVTAAAGDQVRAFREQIAVLHRSRLTETADRLGSSTRSVALAFKTQRVDFDAVRSLRDSLDRSAAGLAGLGDVLDPDAIGKLGAGLTEAADFLDRGVAPAAETAAEGLEGASRPLEVSARRFAAVARATPIDLRPLRVVHDSLARFDEGLAATGSMLDPRRLTAIREATGGAEGVVDEAARMAERAAGFSYPVVEFERLRPKVTSRPFWPRGAEVGADLRKVAVGVSAIRKEVEGLAAELPKVQSAVSESRKAVAATRKTLADALRHQGEVERLLKDMPGQADRLAEELPRLTGGLSKALRATGRLREVAVSLRQARRGMDASVTRWPEVRAGLGSSAAVLRAARDHLDAVLQSRREYETARGEFAGLSEEFARTLPAFSEGLSARLIEEDRTLAEMARGIDQFDRVLPVYSRAATRCLRVGRLLAWLSALIAGLHGVALIAGTRPPPRHQAPAPVTSCS